MAASVLVVGFNGNMGQRYTACLNYLGIQNVGVDIGFDKPSSASYDRILIATPTDTHLALIEEYAKEGKPILCEKPIVKTAEDLERLKEVFDYNDQIFMVNQYAYSMLCIHDFNQPTEYDYFKHGDDGMLWDCIQIIALAEDQITLKESSPVWRCIVNGVHYHQDRMDEYYIAMCCDFAGDMSDLWGQEMIILAHEKVLEHEKDFNRDSGPQHIYTTTRESTSLN